MPWGAPLRALVLLLLATSPAHPTPSAAATADNPASFKAASPRVCLVSYGLRLNSGGIATFTAALASELAARRPDWNITVLLPASAAGGGAARGSDEHDPPAVHVEHLLAAHGNHQRPPLHAAPELKTSQSVLEWLEQQQQQPATACRLVLCHEWRAPCYQLAVARHLGRLQPAPHLLTVLHSPSAWAAAHSSRLPTGSDDLSLDWMERTSASLADVVVSPSKYMLEWAATQGWTLPPRTVVLPNPMPLSALPHPPTPASAASSRPVELVFFGRLEQRKGLDMFCQAIALLSAPARRRLAGVVFVGAAVPQAVEKLDSLTFLRQATDDWGTVPVAIHTNLSTTTALAHIQAMANPLVVIPSVMDNTPYTVRECLYADIPFLSTRVGGIPELLVSDAERCLVEPGAWALGEALDEYLLSENRTNLACRRRFATPSEPTSAAHGWLAEIDGLMAEDLPARSPRREPAAVLVSVCIPTHNRPQLLEQAVRSVAAQTHPAIQLVVAVDGAEALPAHLERLIASIGTGSKVVSSQRRLGDAGARNLAAASAAGEYLVFLDDDNVAKPHMVDAFVQAAVHADADILTCFLDEFASLSAPTPDTSPVSRWIPAGPSVAAGLFRNVFGDTTMAVRATVFRRLGGFDERRHRLAHTDWAFLAHARLADSALSMWVLPAALVWYRSSEAVPRLSTGAGRRPQANHQRIADIYTRAAQARQIAPADVAEILLQAKGLDLAMRGRDVTVSASAAPGEWTMGFALAAGPNAGDIGEFQPMEEVSDNESGATVWRCREDGNANAGPNTAADRDTEPDAASGTQPGCPAHLHHTGDTMHPGVAYTTDGHLRLEYAAIRRWQATAVLETTASANRDWRCRVAGLCGALDDASCEAAEHGHCAAEEPAHSAPEATAFCAEFAFARFPWNCGKGDGVEVSVRAVPSGRVLWMQVLSADECSAEGVRGRVRLPSLHAGTGLDFVVVAGMTDYFDGTTFQASIATCDTNIHSSF